MRAVVQDRYGPPDVLHIEEVERPVPAAGEVLIRVRASTVSQTDTHIRRRAPWRVAAVRRVASAQVANARRGLRRRRRGGRAGRDRVRGRRRGLRHGAAGFGAHAEYVCVPETAPIARKPAEPELRGGRRRLRRRDAGARDPARRGRRARAAGSSSTARPARSGRPRSRSRSTSARTSPASPARRTSSSSARSAPTT